MDNYSQYIERMDSNMKFKVEMLKDIPRDRPINILDYGCGSGELSRIMKLTFPLALVYALDTNPKMLQLAKKNNSADFYISEPDANKYDVIILSSVLHEVEDKLDFVETLARYALRRNGDSMIIIRDGLIREQDRKKEAYISLINPLEAYRFFQEAGDTLVGRLNLNFSRDRLSGTEEDVRNFLQTYTWGFESLSREVHELQVLPESLYTEIQLKTGPTRVSYQIRTQKEYFKHLAKIVHHPHTWETHMIATYWYERG